MANKQTKVQSGCRDMGYLTDSEKRLLFSALTREKGICKVIDKQKQDGILLTPIVESLERKFYYDRFEKEIRNRTIDEIIEKFKGIGIENGYHCSDAHCEYCIGDDEDCEICRDTFRKEIDVIAEEMKRGANETDI